MACRSLIRLGNGSSQLEKLFEGAASGQEYNRRLAVFKPTSAPYIGNH